MVLNIKNLFHWRRKRSPSSKQPSAIRKLSTKALSFDDSDDSNDTFNLESSLASTPSAVDRIKSIVCTHHRGAAESVTVLTSFGVQSGIMLSLVAEACPTMKVLFIHTQGEFRIELATLCLCELSSCLM